MLDYIFEDLNFFGANHLLAVLLNLFISEYRLRTIH